MIRRSHVNQWADSGAAWRLLAAFVGCCALLAAAGCAYNDLAAQRVAAREEGMRRTIGLHLDTEATRMDRLATTAGHIDEQIRLDVERTNRKPQEISEMGELEFNRWPRNQAMFTEELEYQLGGRPERMAPNFIWLFF